MSVSPDLRTILRGPVLEAAPRLLGSTFRHGDVAVRITEVEAYDGANDAGSHAYRGRTPRNEVMFGPAGHLYVYFTYGMHFCCNVVCGEEGVASAVLLRAGQVIEGVDEARVRRVVGTERDLARGPARLCQALGIDLTHNGTLLGGGAMSLQLGEPVSPTQIATGPRVGLRGAPDKPWRFWILGDRYVSDYRMAKPSTRPTGR